ncbi:FKBP-type peptidyl-prolyl cis-trans isomerase [Psychromicrobium sp. YIM B11713]|uniref:FKBP-type peptidyl-prolyl cis-trans isomerase n=1 Tax=Psychromicrobium sp. YIM B11713 TaxID=3145233 RepID=UPI00374F665F
MRRSLALAAAIIPLTVLLSACGGGAASTSSNSASPTSTSDSSSTSSPSAPAANAQLLSSVKVKPGAAGKAPSVEFNKPLAVPEAGIKVVTPGSGAVVTEGQLVSFHSIAFAAKDGKAVGDDYAKPATSLVMDQNFKQNYPLYYSAFVGAKVGSYIAYAAPEQSQNGQVQPASLLIYQIESAKPAPTKASPEEVNKLDSEGKLPTVSFDAKQVPSVKIPSGDAPDNLIVKVLKEGTGDTLEATDSINANYTGWTWSDSKQFDSSYSKGSPIKFGLNQVIAGWTQGLTGQKVGSTVLLVIPTPLAYPSATEGSGSPVGPLVFVVDIVSKA